MTVQRNPMHYPNFGFPNSEPLREGRVMVRLKIFGRNRGGKYNLICNVEKQFP